MSVNANLDVILRRYEELGARLGAGVAQAVIERLRREIGPQVRAHGGRRL